MTAPKAGDRVRVTVEGVLRDLGHYPLTVGDPDDPAVTLVTALGVRAGQVKVLTPPVRAWVRGDVLTYDGNVRFLLDGNKGLAWYDASGQWQSGIDGYHDAMAAGRKDCRAIIRGGKVVAP